MKRILKTEGLKGLFRGLNITILRDSSSYGFYFLSFEYLRRKGKQNGIDNQIFVDLVCGGIAGSLSWFLIMPFDVVKSRIQSTNKKITIRNEFKSVLSEFGYKGFLYINQYLFEFNLMKYFLKDFLKVYKQ
jgi:solute carrier family 25 carnitine/acylcarnitine transporter 20/29